MTLKLYPAVHQYNKENTGRNVIFIRTTSHVGIKDNQVADLAVKKAAQSNVMGTHSVRLDDVNLKIRATIQEK